MTQRQNAHGPEFHGDAQVAWAWHPWAGPAVRVHEVIARAFGSVLRGSPADEGVPRSQAIPVWMLDHPAWIVPLGVVWERRSSVWPEAWSGCHGRQLGRASIGEAGQAFQAEAAAADRPLVRLLEHKGTDRANDRLVVREDADHVGPSLDLLVQPFERMVEAICARRSLGQSI
jgi:hypothetical protein